MSISGGKQRQRQKETTQQAQTQQQQQTTRQVQQAEIPALTSQEQQAYHAASQSELFRLFLAQRLAQEQFQQPLMTPYAQEGMRVLQQRFNDEQDMRGFQGNASPVENARALGMASYLAQLQQDAFQKRLLAGQALSPSSGGLGLMSLQQQRAIAGAPTTTIGTGNITGSANLTGSGTRSMTGTGSQQGFDLGSAGNFLTGIGNLYGAYRGLGGSRYGGLGIGGTGAPVGGYGGGFGDMGYQGGTMYGY